MLNPHHVRDTIFDAIACAPSMQGRCIELGDIVHRLQGYDMDDLARNAPFEFAHFAELLKVAISASNALEALAIQTSTKRGGAQ